MLQIKNIKKEYRTGDLVQKALDDVSLNLRDNEFVAILGPSGSGKTTLLNIIGGLDRYDSGDLIINGISTKKYKDRDWDSYRNHTIGFVFQSYNLISHQTVLSNVELALTISGISGEERRRRATEALKKVGLGEQLHKKPNQLSGGQMQRVAIARALVNDPDILLADEPTGALDSETSVQVMDLLREVAKDRLVVMVTHNPELAEEYATRIVTIKDGNLVSDTDPFVPEGEPDEGIHKNMGRSSMSFLTALALSFNNLKTKKARTILVSFAGSIGIIGIALILSLSNGVNEYIHNLESSTLSEYPLQIEKTGYNLTNLMETAQEMSTTSTESADAVAVQKVVDEMFNGVSNNDLASLKTYLESGQSDIYDQVNAIEYRYNITPQIYKQDGNNLYQVNPNRMFSGMSGGSYSMTSMSSMMSMSLGMDLFHELPSQSSLYMDSYDLKAGAWPEKEDELVLVLDSSGQVSDVLLYAVGLLDREELETAVDTFAKGESVTVSSGEDTYSYDDFLGMEFILINNSSYYAYDEEYKVWTDRSDNTAFVKDLASKGRTLTITGIIQPKEGEEITMLYTGIGYPSSLTQAIMAEAAESDVVKAQLKDPDTNVITGKPFEGDEEDGDVDLGNLFNIDEDAFKDAFDVDTSSMDLSSLSSGMNFGSMDLTNMNLGDLMSEDSLSEVMPSLTQEQVASLLEVAVADKSSEELQALTETMFNSLITGYSTYIGDDASADITTIADDYSTYLESDGARAIIEAKFNEILAANAGAMITEEDLNTMISSIVTGYITYAAENGITDITDPANFQTYLSTSGVMTSMQTQIASKIASISISTDDMTDLSAQLYAGYSTWASANNAAQPSVITQKFQEYLATDEAKNILASSAAQMIDTDAITEQIASILGSSMDSVATEFSTQITQAISGVMTAVATQLGNSMGAMMSSLSDGLGGLFNLDGDAFAGLIEMNMDADEIQDLLGSLLSTNQNSYENNLALMGYADPNDPYEIDIYAKDFNSKNRVVEIIDEYNTMVTEAGEDDRFITYTDTVGTMMKTITDIINTVSYVLIAFVAISLVVSSIMIGVITYISVLERRKEIGILRAIGASKNNIAQVFNAETFITGFLAGIIGVVLTQILILPTNAVIRMVTERDDIHAQLPVTSALILIVLSIILTMIAGLMPSRKAAKSDPVTALRTD